MSSANSNGPSKTKVIFRFEDTEPDVLSTIEELLKHHNLEYSQPLSKNVCLETTEPMEITETNETPVLHIKLSLQLSDLSDLSDLSCTSMHNICNIL